jgi:hypothetical protein
VSREKKEPRERPGFIESLGQDVRYGLRVLRRNPAFTLTAVITLALGIGANTVIFSVIYGVLLRPLPYREGERLVVVRRQARLNNVNSMGFSVKEFEDYRDQNKTMEAMVEHHSMSFILYGREEPERVQTSGPARASSRRGPTSPPSPPTYRPRTPTPTRKTSATPRRSSGWTRRSRRRRGPRS